MNRSAPTIQDVARAAQVSTATVSRTLSFPERVTDRTRQRVMEAVERTGYSPNQTARNLRRRTTGAIVVLVPNLGNPFFSQILAGIEQAASAAGYTVLICDTLQRGAGEAMLRDYLRSNRADGLISLDGGLPASLFGIRSDGLRPPAAIFACEWSDRVELPSVRFDNEAGAAMAVAHLAGLGHRTIGHVLGPLENVLTRARYEGYRRGLAEAGLVLDPRHVLGGDFSLEAGAIAARSWIELASRPSAMVFSSDWMACGFISEVHAAGLRVPEDVSVVGFDDIDIAGRFIPALTTIRQPRLAIGVAAFETLAETMQATVSTETRECTTRLLPAELIVRESTRRA